MRILAYLIAIVCVAAAVMYEAIPAGQLPAFVPGHLSGSDHIHRTHAVAAAVAAVVIFLIGFLYGRSRKLG